MNKVKNGSENLSLAREIVFEKLTVQEEDAVRGGTVNRPRDYCNGQPTKESCM